MLRVRHTFLGLIMHQVPKLVLELRIAARRKPPQNFVCVYTNQVRSIRYLF